MYEYGSCPSTITRTSITEASPNCRSCTITYFLPYVTPPVREALTAEGVIYVSPDLH